MFLKVCWFFKDFVCFSSTHRIRFNLKSLTVSFTKCDEINIPETYKKALFEHYTVNDHGWCCKKCIKICVFLYVSRVRVRYVLNFLRFFYFMKGNDFLWKQIHLFLFSTVNFFRALPSSTYRLLHLFHS